MQKQKIIVILGQTATGKSDLAVSISKTLAKSGVKSEVISADSRQVYTGLDIGTGKITKNEMKGIPHHLLDVANPKRKFTVAQYKKIAEEKIKDILGRGNVPIICGGTGFYIDAITRGVIFPEVPPNPKLRKILDKKKTIELFKMLQKLDKKRAKNIQDKNEINNKVRLIRAIEIVKSLGKVPKITEALPPYKFTKIGLYLPIPILEKKVEKRVKKMFQNGLLNEIKKLRKIGISKKRLHEFGFEYDNPTIDNVIKETIKYTKRQMTWFKRDSEIIWHDTSDKNLESKVLTILKKDFL